MMLGAVLFFIISVWRLVTLSKKKNIDDYLYGKTQIISFIILHAFLALAFDSAQVFMFAMCFSSIVNFSFINARLAKFQSYASFITVILSAGVISVYTGSKATMLAFTFGSAVLIVINWVIISMASHIVYQYRINSEQERSLDDMLKLVETKCHEAQKATRSKSRFLANMSHEIRTPINTVIGMNEMILRESDDSNIIGYAMETKNAAESLLSIINDILDITKIEAGKLTAISAEYSLSQLINDVYNMIKFKAEAKNLRFTVIADETLPCRLVGDDIRLKQILVNLLSNAIKYTHEGSVTLEIRYINEGQIRFSVKDTGIGIKSEDIGRLFVVFDRMEEEKNRTIEGTGLGLPITASLLKMFNSELKVDSVYDKGSEFWFVIDQEIADPEPIGKIDLTAREYHKNIYRSKFTAPNASILVVDDNTMNRKVFINLLKDTQISISEAESGMECLEKISTTHYDIIFMDHMMPEMDGVETLAAMRRQEYNKCRNTPVIALTANAVVGAEEYYMDKGFDGFLSKPIEPDKLEKLVFALLKDDIIECHELTEDKKEPAKELPIINGIDWNYARLHFKDDALLLHTVKMFRNSIDKDTAELDMYYDSIDNEASVNSYRIKVHSMKSSSALIGIIHLSGMAAELENAARNGSTDIIRALHPVFMRSWKSYSELLRELVEDKSERENASAHADEIADIFAQIRSGAEELDVDILDEMSRKLDEYAFDEQASAKIEEIKAHILNFETEKLIEFEYPVF